MFCPHPKSSTTSEWSVGQHSDAPELCRHSGSRGTGCVHYARPGLWGGRLGNHRLYPEADTFSLRLSARLTAGIRRLQRERKKAKKNLTDVEAKKCPGVQPRCIWCKGKEGAMLSEGALRAGAVACFTNAQELYDEAKLLYEQAQSPRSVVLALIGAE